MMPLLLSPSRKPRHAAIRCRVVVRMLIALLVAVALPAQAISASVERVWNAAHYHLEGPGRPDARAASAVTFPAPQAEIKEHYPLQLARDIAAGVQPASAAQKVEDAPRSARLDAHAQAHGAGIAHHHDADTRGVIYVADAGEQPISATERTGKHDHDGFSPAVPAVRALAARFQDSDPALMNSTPRMSHVFAPGERPPR